MGLITVPEHHADTYRNAVDMLASSAGAPRVLVSGAADYAMLAVVRAACRERDIAPELVVLDRCETPLMLNRWYAARGNFPISTRRSDILEYEDPRPFDLVCTHSFLGQFSLDERPRVAAKWRELLRPGGVAVTVNRLRPANGPESIGFTQEQALAFRDKVLQKAHALPDGLAIDAEELAHEAEIYASRNTVYPVHSCAEVRALFEGAGFEIAQLSGEPVSHGAPSGATGPTVLGGADYVRVIATRT